MKREARNAGFSLIEVLISFGVLGGVILGYLSISKFEGGSNAKQDNLGRIQNVRNFVRGFLNCSVTMTPAAVTACTKNTAIDVRQADGQVIVAAAGTTLVGNRYQLSDVCSLSGSVASLTFLITDKLTANPTGKDLFDGIPVSCFVLNPPPPPIPPPPPPVPPVGCTGGPTFLWLPAALENKISQLLPTSGTTPYYGCYPENPSDQNPPGQPFTCMTGPYASPICQSLLTAMATANPHYGLSGSFSPAYEVFLSGQWQWFPWYYDFDGGDYYQYAGMVFSGQPPYAWQFDVNGLAEDIIDGAVNVPSITGTITVPATILETGTNTGAPGFYPYYQMPMVIAWPNVTNGVFTIKISPVDSQGTNLGGATCSVSIATESPLVLDLSGGSELRTLSLFASHAFFDLTGEGPARHTGWTRPGTALLALDRNGNGRIDSGRELFGTETLLPDGTRASNGYEALAQYDLGHKGFIDAGDPIFSRLLLWTDANGNGISDPGELQSVSDAGITRLSVVYEPVPPEIRKRERSGNSLRYRSRFWGPEACGEAGCRSYDVYFLSESSRSGRAP